MGAGALRGVHSKAVVPSPEKQRTQIFLVSCETFLPPAAVNGFTAAPTPPQKYPFIFLGAGALVKSVRF